MVFVVQMVCNAAQASRNDVFVILADLLGIVAVSGCVIWLHCPLILLHSDLAVEVIPISGSTVENANPDQQEWQTSADEYSVVLAAEVDQPFSLHKLYSCCPSLCACSLFLCDMPFA